MTRRNKPSTSQALRPTPLIALAVVMILMASTVMAGVQPDGPETTEVGSEGNEKYAVEWKDGYEVNVNCGAMRTVCPGVGAIVIDIEETFVVLDMFGYSAVEGQESEMHEEWEEVEILWLDQIQQEWTKSRLVFETGYFLRTR